MCRLILALCLALAPLAAAAQKASSAQIEAVSAVGNCVATGLPEQWKRLQVIVTLPQPMAETGGVLYLVTMLDDRVQPFPPCDPRLPPIKLIELREHQAEGERGWIKATLTMRPDASFDLKYEYPEKKSD
jgi:hypothetical protein